MKKWAATVLLMVIVVVILLIAGYLLLGNKSTPGNKAPSEAGQFCGGIAGVQCPAGYQCKYDGSYPDAGGICVEYSQK